MAIGTTLDEALAEYEAETQERAEDVTEWYEQDGGAYHQPCTRALYDLVMDRGGAISWGEWHGTACTDSEEEVFFAS